MAGFEFARAATIAEVARESRIGRYLPLYLAGLAAGAAIGLGISFSHPGAGAARAYAGSAAAPVSGSPTVAGPAAYELSAPFPPDIVISTPIVESPPTVVVQVPTVAAADPPAAAPTVAAAPSVAPPVAPTAAPAAPPVPVAQAAPAAPAAANPPAAPAAAPARANFYVPAVSTGGPTALEQQLFDGINTERAKAGLPPYAYDAGLTKIARTRSQQMVDQGYFAHVDPFGYTMYTALLAYFGYTSYNWAGENLALNNYPVSETAARALVALMNSPTHRDNLLASDFFRIGIGEVTTADGRHIFSMIFLG